MTLITILMADNDSDFLNVRAEYLEQNGYRVLRAATPEQARRLLSEEHLHLAVLDVRLVDDDDEKDASGLLLAEDDLFRASGIVEIRNCPMRFVHQSIRSARRREITAEIGILLDQCFQCPVNHLLGNLRARGIIKVDARASGIGNG